MTFPQGAEAAVPTILAAFVGAALIALLATPAIRRFFRRQGIIDHPDERRVHRRPLPRGGGFAVVAGFLVVGGGLAIWSVIDPEAAPVAVGLRPAQLVGLFLGGLIAAVIGAVDDALDLRARWQLVGQIAVALVAVGAGIGVRFIGNPITGGTIVFPDVVGIAFTVVWIVGMINSLNFIDGLDGLSSGISLIAAVTLGIISLTDQVDQPFVAVLCFAFAGGLLGFLRWNFHPAVIFQGTAGVMFLGYTLGVLSILGTAKVMVALLVLGVPIVDSFWVIVRRLSVGRSPFTPDRGHIHHRLLDVGLSHRSTVLLIYVMCATLGLMSLFVPVTTSIYAFVAIVLGFGLLVFVLGRRPTAGLDGPINDDVLRP